MSKKESQCTWKAPEIQSRDVPDRVGVQRPNEELHDCRSQGECLLISRGCSPRMFDEKIAK